jgi:hypothetical protein
MGIVLCVSEAVFPRWGQSGGPMRHCFGKKEKTAADCRFFSRELWRRDSGGIVQVLRTIQLLREDFG